MSKKLGLALTLVGIVALSSFFLSCGSSSSRPSGLLYVLTDGTTGIGNNVSSFAIDLNTGNLSLVNSNATTCSTLTSNPPVPCGIPLDIVLDPLGATAFVLNQGVPCVQGVCSSANPVPPTIYPYTVNSDGSFSSPRTPVTWTGNDTAVAMVRDDPGQFLFVINQGVYPAQAACPGSGAGCPSISVFAMKPGSTTLTLAAGSPFYLSKLPTALSPVTFTPVGGAAQELLYVTNNHDICTTGCNPPHNDNTVSVYSVSSAGALTEQTFSPYQIFATDPVSVIAVNTNPAGSNSGGLFIYVGTQDQNGGHLNPFEVCTVVNSTICTQADVDSSLMVPLGTCPLVSCNTPPSSVGQSPGVMVTDPTNNFLYVVSSGSNQVWAFRMNTAAGTLTALTPANQPTGGFPVSMALHPSINSDGQNITSTGQYLYTSNSTSSNITGFTLSPTTGAMSNPITVVAPAAPSGMAVR
jgi:hypothetical protein